jgi:hypothetical protein
MGTSYTLQPDLPQRLLEQRLSVEMVLTASVNIARVHAHIMAVYRNGCDLLNLIGLTLRNI